MNDKEFYFILRTSFFSENGFSICYGFSYFIQINWASLKNKDQKWRSNNLHKTLKTLWGNYLKDFSTSLLIFVVFLEMPSLSEWNKKNHDKCKDLFCWISMYIVQNRILCHLFHLSTLKNQSNFVQLSIVFFSISYFISAYSAKKVFPFVMVSLFSLRQTVHLPKTRNIESDILKSF